MHKAFVATILMTAASAAFAAGGGGGGGGGSTGGCTWIQSASVKAGYPPKGLGVVQAAIWTTYGFQQCSTASPTVATITVTNLDDATEAPGSWRLGVVGKVSGVLDDDRVSFSTNYRVDVVVTDYATGTVLDSRSIVTFTPPPKAPTPGS